MSDYGRTADLLYLDAHTDADRKEILAAILTDDSRTTQPLKALRNRYKFSPLPTANATNALRADAGVAVELSIEAAPTLIEIDGDSKRVVKIDDVLGGN